MEATAGKAVYRMCYVYLLVSLNHPNQHYVGLTRDLKTRLRDHNQRRSKHTSKFVPWKLAAYFAFVDKSTATAFEAYLKSGSGKAFLKRHLSPRG
jgi:predicted GIY-YIG superfamily endonuclease